MDDLKLGIILAQMINFWILFFIFKHFLGEKIVKAIEERRAYIQKFDDADKQVKQTLAAADKQAGELVDEARTKAHKIEADAEELAKANTQKEKQKAAMEAESILGNARADIEKERLSMLNEMKSKIVDLSLKLNEKMFSKESANKDFMEKELEALK